LGGEGMERDYLTGALDRHGLYEWYEGLPKGVILQFMFLDLDNFKVVNDMYGHSTGDRLLVAVAKILETCMEQAMCVRLSGDEFVVVIKERVRRQKVIEAAELINKRIQKKEGFSDVDTDISASIGILLNQNSKEPIDTVLFKIDTAMYQAKENGKACYVVFNDIAEDVYDHMQMERNQSEALSGGEFEIYYKPVINSQTSKLVLSEAKLIWNMGNGRKRYQEEFIPLFEKNGFIRELNLWAFGTLCKHITGFYNREKAKGRVGIRFSRRLLAEKNFTETLEAMMRVYGVEKNEICIEVEEKAFLKDSDKIAEGLRKLHDKGFLIAVINTGSEFASLKYWDLLHFDYVVFNASYIKGALSTPRGKSVLRVLFSIGNDLNIKMVADGVSVKDDLVFLGSCGCMAVSGEYFSNEMSPQDYRGYVEGKIPYGRQKAEFQFIDGFSSTDGKFDGSVIGDVTLAEGISSKWGSIYFPGGDIMDNILLLPSSILAGPSYTIGMWLKPVALNSWTSALYARYIGGFMSYVPYESGGNSVFRINEDSDLDRWHDILSRQIQKDKWSFVCITYNEGVSRCYINGRRCGYRPDIPLLPVCKQIVAGGDPFQPPYNGYMSALVFFDGAMSADEVNNWYKEFLSEEGFKGEEETFWMEDKPET